MQLAQELEDESESDVATENTDSKKEEPLSTKAAKLAITDGTSSHDKESSTSSKENHATENSSSKQSVFSSSSSVTGKPSSKVTSPGSSSSSVTETEKKKDKKKHELKLSDKQKEELKKFSEEREIARKERVEHLVKKLIERLEYWTTSDKKPAVVEYLREKTRAEAEELKMESFGIQILHAIGTTYYTKGTNYLKSQKLLGIGGIFGKFKEKYTVAKDTWNTISSALDAQYTLQDIAKMEENPEELTEAEKVMLERQAMGKILAAAWNGSRFEIQSVLREVCDAVLHDKSVSAAERCDRAQGLIIIGDVFRKTTRTKEEEEEVQIFEELVAEAATSKKSKKHKKHAHDASKAEDASKTEKK